MVTNIHPAPGIGDLIPGTFVVPQNPLAPVQQVAGIGDIIAGQYPVPQNPLRALSGLTVNGIGKIGDCGCGCGGSGACRDTLTRVLGMGDINLGPFGNLSLPDIPDTIAGISTKYWIIGGLVLAFALSRGSDYRDSASALRAKYRYDLAKLRGQSPRRYARVQRDLADRLA